MLQRIRPHWRKMTWAVVIWCVVMAIWIVAAIAGADSASNCADPGSISRATCEDVSDAGTGIGVVLLWFVWFFGFIPLSLIWFMTRPKGRECLACGERVKRGLTACPSCQYDFAAAAGAPPVVVDQPSGS
jgi:hypothetical protein